MIDVDIGHVEKVVQLLERDQELEYGYQRLSVRCTAMSGEIVQSITEMTRTPLSIQINSEDQRLTSSTCATSGLPQCSGL